MASSSFASRFATSANMMLGGLYPSMIVPPQDLSSRTAIVTGANTGIGLECARKLAAMGAYVVLACRNPAKGESARKDILQGDTSIESERVRVEALDLGDGNSVRQFVERWGNKPLGILINNAGMTSHTYRHATNTATPYELMYYTDILSHIQLTLALLPAFTPNARIVNITSIAQYEIKEHLDASDGDLSWVKHIEQVWGSKLGDEWTSVQSKEIYFRVKFMQVVFTKELQARLDAHPTYQQKNIGVYVCNPGLVKTEMYTRPEGTFGGTLESADKTFIKMVEKLALPAEQGACTAVFLASSPSEAVTSPAGRGAYYDRMKKWAPNALVADGEKRAEVWKVWMREVQAEGVDVAAF